MEFGIDYPISMALLKVIMGDHGGETVWEHDVRNAHAGLGSLRPAQLPASRSPAGLHTVTRPSSRMDDFLRPFEEGSHEKYRENW